MKRGTIPLIITILLLSSILSPTIVRPSHASSITGKICLADPSTVNPSTPCPSVPPTFDGPVGQQIRIGVYINGSDGLAGFTVILNATHTVLLPIGIDLTGSVLQTPSGPPQIFAECVNDLLVKGPACSGADSPDTLDISAGVAIGAANTITPTTGLLFTAIYNITISASSTPLGFQTSSTFCNNSSVAASGGGPVCVSVSSPPSTTPLPETVQTAKFDNSNSATMADVTISASQNNFGPEFPGTSNTTTITATANNGFPGTAIDSVLFSVIAPLGLSAAVTGTNPCATTGSSCLTTISFSPTLAGTFVAKVFGTYATLDPTGNPDTLVSSTTLTIVSDDFSFKAAPSHISFPSGSIASGTLAVASLNGFAGKITLSTGIIAPASPPLTVSLTTNSITLSAGQTLTTNVTFTASPTTTTAYHAQIKASFGTRVKTILENLTVTIATPDFTISANPLAVTAKPGVSATSAITVTAVSGFTGTVTLSVTTNSTNLACSLNATSITSGSGVSTLSCSGSLGNYLAIITGTSGTLVHSVNVAFNVIPPITSGLVCIAPSGSTSCPASMAFLNFTGSIPGQLRVAVVISNSSGMTGFDVILFANHTILRPVGIDLSGTVLHGTPQILAECLSGTLVQGSACNSRVTADTLELAAASAPGSSPTPAPTTGLLFTAIFNITTPSTGTVLSFQSGCTNTGVSNGLCVTIANPITGVPDVESTQAAIVSTSTSPDFVVTVTPNFLTVKAGSSATSTLTASSVNGFFGLVNFNFSSMTTITVTTSAPSLTLTKGQTLSATLIISPSMLASAGNYTITVKATSGTLIHIVTLIVFVFVPLPPDFGISANPSLLTVQAGNQATATIFLNSIGGFQGTITVFESSAALAVGVNVTINPTSVTLQTNGSSTIVLTISTATITPASFNSITLTATSGALSHSAFITVQVLPPPDEPPIASFFVSPTAPFVGQQAGFEAFSSFDPDGFIVQYQWNFGDASGLYITTSQSIFHTFFSPGNYTVTLTVYDSSGLTATASQTVNVIPQPAHDVSINELSTFETIAVSSQNIGFEALLSNQGSNIENVTLVIYANGRPVVTETGIILPACSGGCFEFFVFANWDTTGIVQGNYTISATVFLPPGDTDPTPQDNSIIGPTLTILPPPVLVAAPNAGAVGDKVTIKGTGFSAQSPFFSQTNFIEITFDDMIAAFIPTPNGTFTATLDVPLSQPGNHFIKAFDETNGAHTTTAFQVLPNLTTIIVTVETGAIYFPGDTATIYILTTANGTKIGPAGVQLQVILVFPNGTIRSLSATAKSPGLYTAVYNIPSKASLGTYSAIAVAHMPGAIDGSAIAGFEVQPTWLSSHGSMIVGGTAVAGILGFAGIAWQRGYFRKRKSDALTETC